MTKTIIIVVVVIVIIGLSVFVSRPVYMTYVSGDIGMGKVLQYPLLKTKLLCNIFGGEYKKEVSGWSNKVLGNCIVNNPRICNRHGGEIKNSGVGDYTQPLMGVSNGCYKRK